MHGYDYTIRMSVQLHSQHESSNALPERRWVPKCVIRMTPSGWVFKCAIRMSLQMYSKGECSNALSESVFKCCAPSRWVFRRIINQPRGRTDCGRIGLTPCSSYGRQSISWTGNPRNRQKTMIWSPKPTIIIGKPICLKKNERKTHIWRFAMCFSADVVADVVNYHTSAGRRWFFIKNFKDFRIL